MNAGSSDNETENLSNYGFLYGTIPTAPSVFVYATKYGIGKLDFLIISFLS